LPKSRQKTFTTDILFLNICMDSNITISDLDAIKSIIDLAARRGAFGAGEMAEVGAVYNKLDAFLNAVTAQSAPVEEQPPEGE
jgi:hypothetical protein